MIKMDFDVFVQIHDAISSGNDQSLQQYNELIEKLQEENPQLFLSLSIQVFQDQSSTLNRIISCLSGILKLIKPSSVNPIFKICEFWNNPSMNEITNNIKLYLFNCIPNEHLPIQNLSSFAFALIFIIESKDKINPLWSDILVKLSNGITDNSSSEPCKHGCLTFFSEIIRTPIFKRTPQFQTFLIPGFHIILGKLIENLSSPTSISEPLFRHSIQFIFELITTVPQIISNEEEASILLNSYNSALPKCINPEDYKLLFVIILELIKYNYVNIGSLMSKIFELSYKGITCPNKSIVIISIEFWEQICLFEKSLPANIPFKKYSKTAMEALFGDLLKIMSQMDNEASITCVSLLRNFTKLYPKEMIELSRPEIDQILSNRGQLDNPEMRFYVIFNLINALCVKHFNRNNESPLNDLPLLEYFLIIVDIICKCNSHILIQIGLITCNSLIQCSNQIPNDKRILEFVNSVINNRDLMLQFKIEGFQICRSLFKKSHTIHFEAFFDVLFNLAFDSDITDTDDSINNAFSSLVDLISNKGNEFNLSNTYHIFFKLLQKYNDKLSITDNFSQIRLRWILDIICKYIYCLDNKFKPFSQDLVEELIRTSGVHRDLAYEDVLIVFSHLCIALRKEFDFSQNVLELVEYGMNSQSPSIMKTSFELYSDLYLNVGTQNCNPIEMMFHIRENFPFIFEMIKFSFIECFAKMLLGTEKENSSPKNVVQFPPEFLDEYKSIIDGEISRNLYDPQSSDFDLRYATEFYKSVFYFYAAFFDRTEKSNEDMANAKSFICKQVFQCYKSGTYKSINTLYALYRLLNVLYRKYETKLGELNLKFLKKMLKDEEVLANEDPKYQKIFDKFLEMIRTGK